MCFEKLNIVQELTQTKFLIFSLFRASGKQWKRGEMMLDVFGWHVTKLLHMHVERQN